MQEADRQRKNPSEEGWKKLRNIITSFSVENKLGLKMYVETKIKFS